MTKIFLALLLSAGGLSIHNAEANSLREMAATVTEAPADTAATASLKAKIVLPDPKIEVPRQTTSVKHTAKNYTPIVLRNKVYDQVQDNRFVDGYISNYAQRYSNHLAIMAGRAAPHFNMIEKVFSDHGVPEEMKYLAVIESGMSHTARSRVGAVGMWQFMSSTARIFGLSVGKKVDERKDVYKSTVAAAKYLKELHTQFGDWLLVVAAYNCGPGNLMRAQRISGRSDFWGIQNFLPAESRNHVYKFIATGYILDRFNTFFGVNENISNSPATRLKVGPEMRQPIPLSDEDIYNTVEVNIKGKDRLEAIAEALKMEKPELERLNPNFKTEIAGATNQYDLRIPKEKMQVFLAQKDQILKHSLDLTLDDKGGVDRNKFPAPVKKPSTTTKPAIKK